MQKYGRIPIDPPYPGRVAGPMTRTVEDAALAMTVLIAAASAVVLHWTVVFTLALACVIVLIAKGPAYVADAYPLIDSDRPAR